MVKFVSCCWRWVLRYVSIGIGSGAEDADKTSHDKNNFQNGDDADRKRQGHCSFKTTVKYTVDIHSTSSASYCKTSEIHWLQKITKKMPSGVGETTKGDFILWVLLLLLSLPKMTKFLCLLYRQYPETRSNRYKKKRWRSIVWIIQITEDGIVVDVNWSGGQRHCLFEAEAKESNSGACIIPIN